jgi:DNA-binding winged helix-turn-helix (wHTH) protein/TolB-like protein/Flp pilus assembly protein TadD
MAAAGEQYFEGTYRFGPFLLDPCAHELLENDQPVPLPPKAFETLLVLVRHRGVLMSKDELMKAVWPDAYVEENNLMQYVSMLRRTLGEHLEGQEYIKTIPKIGYRFVAEVHEGPAANGKRNSDQPKVATHGAVAEAAALPVGQALRSPVGVRARNRFIRAAIAAVLLMTVGAVIYWASSSPRPSSQVSASESPAVVAAPHTLAVLPLRNLKPDPQTDFLSLALTDAVINRLGSVRELVVTPSASILKYRNTDADPRQVARELHVGTVLSGSYLKEGNDLRVTTELINVEGSDPPLRQNIDLRYEKLFSVQDRVAEGVIHGMGLQIKPEELEITRRGLPTNPLAYEYFLRATDLGFASNFEGAVKLLEKAVALEPNNAMAWCMLATSYLGYAANQGGGKVYAEKGWQAFRKARALDPENQLILGIVAFQLIENNRIDEGLPLLRELLHRNPNDSWAHWYLSEAYRYGGALQESKQEGELARKFNPNIPQNTTLNTYLYLGEYDKFLASLPSEENARISFYRGLARYYMGDKTRALVEFDHASALNPALLHSQIGAALAKAITGKQAEGLELMKRVELAQTEDGEMVYKMAQAYAQLGDSASSMRLLRRAIDLNFYPYDYFFSDLLLNPVRQAPQYLPLVELARQRQAGFRKKYF